MSESEVTITLTEVEAEFVWELVFAYRDRLYDANAVPDPYALRAEMLETLEKIRRLEEGVPDEIHPEDANVTAAGIERCNIIMQKLHPESDEPT